MNDAINKVLSHNVFTWIVPEIILLAGACIVFLGGTFHSKRSMWGAAALGCLGLAGAALALYPTATVTRAALYVAPVTLDRLAIFFKILSLGAIAVLILTSWNEIPDGTSGEYYACLLTISAGLSLTGGSNDLVTLFLALELISIPTYILLYLPRRDFLAQEAAMKYFLLSIFSSALLLFGFSFLYGLTGTTNLTALAEALTRGTLTPTDTTLRLPGAGMAALVLVLAGMAFKLAAVPFHFYAPDVYQGVSHGGAAFLAFVPKAAGIAAIIRVFSLVPITYHSEHGLTLLDPNLKVGWLMGMQVSTLFWIMAAFSMILGNLLALLQNNLRRLLAYSSIGHAGYMLIGLAAAPHLQGLGILESSGTSALGVPGGVESVLFYLVAYGAMTIGAFAVLGYLHSPERPVENVDDLGGLAKSHPGLALLMGLFLFSLIGVPPTAGFFGKLFLLQDALAIRSSGSTGVMDTAALFRILAVITVLSAAVGAWYYLRIAAVIFLRTPLKPLARIIRVPNWIGLAACGLITLFVAIWSFPSIQSTVLPPETKKAESAP